MSTSGRTPSTCPVCGAAVHPKDRFCGACGADVVGAGATSGSLYDELMPGSDPSPTPAAGYVPPSDDGGDDRATAAYSAGRYEDPAYRHSGSADTDDRYEDRGYEPSGYDDGYGEVPPPRQDRPSRGSVLLPLAILLVVLLVGIFAWQLAPRGGDDDTVASGTDTSQDAGGASGSPSADDGGTPDASPSAEATGPEQISMASTAERCDDVEDSVAYRGNEVTSCDFAVEVAQALSDSAPDLPATVTARSPVTKKEYTMECENTAPVTCRGGNDALVYVDRG